MGIAYHLGTLTFAVDLAQPNDNEMYYCVGGEWWIKNSIALRGGYRSNQDIGSGLLAGLGFKAGKTQIDSILMYLMVI